MCTAISWWTESPVPPCPAGRPRVTASSVTAEQMALSGKGPTCILLVPCMLKAEEHQARWGLLKPRTESPILWWELGPSQCWPSTSMTPLLQLLCGRNDVSGRITDLSVSISTLNIICYLEKSSAIKATENIKTEN